MTDTSSWWARKLAAQQGQPAAAPLRPAAPQYPQTGTTPPPAHLPPATQQQVGQVTPENLMEAASQWKGGKATRTETAHCPDCGSANFFSNRESSGAAGGAGPVLYTQQGAMTVAPRCFECGFTTAHGKQTGAMG